MSEILTKHYEENHARLVKRYSFRAGTVWDAEDVVQEAYANALKYIKAHDGRDFNKWLTTILINCLKDHRRNEDGLGKNREEFEEEDFEAIHASLSTKQTNQEIVCIIECKPEPVKDVLKLWFIDELAPKEISMITGVTHTYCRVIIKRFRDELKALYS